MIYIAYLACDTMTFRGYALWFSAACILIFILQVTIGGFTELFVLNELSWSQPWRFVSAMFLHGDLVHLLYNLFALALFGSMLERIQGGRAFLLTFFATGIIANIVAVNFYSSSLGASGAIFGVIGALVVLRPLLVVWAFGLPMPLFVAGIIWVAGDIIGTFIPSNVGTIAHLSGVAIGLIIGVVYRFRNPPGSTRKLDTFVIEEKVARDWEDAYLR